MYSQHLSKTLDLWQIIPVPYFLHCDFQSRRCFRLRMKLSKSCEHRFPDTIVQRIEIWRIRCPSLLEDCSRAGTCTVWSQKDVDICAVTFRIQFQARSQDCQNEEADRSSVHSPPLPSIPSSSLPSLPFPPFPPILSPPLPLEVRPLKSS